MLPSTKDRKANFHSFMGCYSDICKLHNLYPLPNVKAHLSKKVLDFNADSLKLLDWGPVIKALSQDQALHFIAIRSKCPLKKVMEDINTEEKTHKVNKKPVLLTRFIFYQLVETLRDCLVKTKSLSCIELDGLPMSEEYLNIFVKGISMCESLQHISLDKCQIGDQGCETICVNIKNLPNLTSINLSGCNITYKGCEMIAGLIKHQKLNRFTATWMGSLRYRHPDLDSMSGLKRISLNNNNELGDEGASELCEALIDDLWIKALDLQNCGLSNVGARHILKILSLNTYLAIVDVRNNPLVKQDVCSQIMQQLSDNNRYRRNEFHWLNIPTPSHLPTRSSTARVMSQTSQRTGTLHRQRSAINASEAASKHPSSNLRSKVTVTNGIPWRVSKRLETRRDYPHEATPGVPNASPLKGEVPPLAKNSSPNLSNFCQLKDAMKDLSQKFTDEVERRKRAEIRLMEIRKQNGQLVERLRKKKKKFILPRNSVLLEENTLDAVEKTLNDFSIFLESLKGKSFRRFDRGFTEISPPTSKIGIERCNGWHQLLSETSDKIPIPTKAVSEYIKHSCNGENMFRSVGSLYGGDDQTKSTYDDDVRSRTCTAWEGKSVVTQTYEAKSDVLTQTDFAGTQDNESQTVDGRTEEKDGKEVLVTNIQAEHKFINLLEQVVNDGFLNIGMAVAHKKEKKTNKVIEDKASTSAESLLPSVESATSVSSSSTDIEEGGCKIHDILCKVVQRNTEGKGDSGLVEKSESVEVMTKKKIKEKHARILQPRSFSVGPIPLTVPTHTIQLKKPPLGKSGVSLPSRPVISKSGDNLKRDRKLTDQEAKQILKTLLQDASLPKEMKGRNESEESSPLWSIFSDHSSPAPTYTTEEETF